MGGSFSKQRIKKQETNGKIFDFKAAHRKAKSRMGGSLISKQRIRSRDDKALTPNGTANACPPRSSDDSRGNWHNVRVLGKIADPESTTGPTITIFMRKTEPYVQVTSIHASPRIIPR